jgi:hypothetical protein
MKKQQNKEGIDIVKEVKRDDFIHKIKEIDDLSWKEAYDIVHEFCYLDIKLDLNEIKQILCFKDKDLVDLFLREYILFDKDDRVYLELFINDNLEHENTEFVSDLLYFACDLSLNIDYLRVMSLIDSHVQDENYVVLGALNYISTNVKYYYINEIFSTMQKVFNSEKYYQSEQILASIILYRISNKTEYLIFIKELLLADEGNILFLTNLLKEEAYQEEYFNIKVFKEHLSMLN